MILVIVGASVFRLQCILTGASEFSRWLMLPGSLDAFATGGLVAWILRNKRASAVTSKTWFVAAVSCSGGFSGFFALLAVPAGYQPWHCGVELFECVFFGWLLLRLAGLRIGLERSITIRIY